MTIDSARIELKRQLLHIYEEREAQTISDWVLEHITKLSKTARLIEKTRQFSAMEQADFDSLRTALLKHRPVQYVLGEAWFAGLKFTVNESVLIPRPETEELVNWAIQLVKQGGLVMNKVLDIGTGSGCIPVVLKKQLPHLAVASLDISSDALLVAEKNARDNLVDIDFFQLDFLDEKNWESLPVVDLLISNPPYIRQEEGAAMAKNVLDFE
ncbi:MAG: peptide chain release factor N(5)-glutamine methyltransferase, partial [Bacteroidota bacterium]